MRFRFSATTSSGEPRAGILEAVDENAARAQLSRRGLTIESLQQNDSEVPVYVRPADEPLRLPSDFPERTAGGRPINPIAAALDTVRSVSWRELEWRRIAAAAAVVVLVVGFARWSLGRFFADRSYSVEVTGEVHVQTRRTLSKDHWRRLRAHLWFPEFREAIGKDGIVWARTANGKWARKGRGTMWVKVTSEGNYTVQASLALPSAPRSCRLYLSHPGFRRQSQPGQLRASSNVLRAQLEPMRLPPRRRGKRNGSPSPTPAAAAAQVRS